MSRSVSDEDKFGAPPPPYPGTCAKKYNARKPNSLLTDKQARFVSVKAKCPPSRDYATAQKEGDSRVGVLVGSAVCVGGQPRGGMHCPLTKRIQFQQGEAPAKGNENVHDS